MWDFAQISCRLIESEDCVAGSIDVIGALSAIW